MKNDPEYDPDSEETIEELKEYLKKEYLSDNLTEEEIEKGVHDVTHCCYCNEKLSLKKDNQVSFVEPKAYSAEVEDFISVSADKFILLHETCVSNYFSLLLAEVNFRSKEKKKK